MVTKYEIAKAFFECQQKRDEFYEQLPESMREAIYDNPSSLAQEQLQHILLSQLLTEEQLDTMAKVSSLLGGTFLLIFLYPV